MFDRLGELKCFVEGTLSTKRPTLRVPPEEDYVAIVFWGWELVLFNDGTWYCLDTSGG